MPLTLSVDGSSTETTCSFKIGGQPAARRSIPGVTDHGGAKTPKFLGEMYAEDIAPLRAYYHDVLGLPIDDEQPGHTWPCPTLRA